MVVAEWGAPMTMAGPFYIIQDYASGAVRYCSARAEWEAMHEELAPGVWLKTATVDAYQLDGPAVVSTVLASGHLEVYSTAGHPAEAGDWIVRQQGGEIQVISQETFPGIYIVPEETG
jgi:hypothetical protein